MVASNVAPSQAVASLQPPATTNLTPSNSVVSPSASAYQQHALAASPEPAVTTAVLAGSAPLASSFASPADARAAHTGAGQRPAPAAPTGLAASAGGSAGGGFSPSFFLALLVALAGLTRLLSERLRLPSVIWRPTVFIALQERPG
jgi:hypothetical protein